MPSHEQNEQLLETLSREGVLISVSVRYWRAAKKLTPEDLGLDQQAIASDLISLGHKKLLKKDALRPFSLIESRAHALIEANTFPFLGGLGHFLPNAKLEEVTARLDGLEQEFTEARDTFVSNYADVREEALREWGNVAASLEGDPERLLGTIHASFPRRDQVYDRFRFSTYLFQVVAPQQLSLELVTAGDQLAVSQARERAAARAAERIRAGAEGFITDCVASLRQQTAQLCDEMLKSMQSGTSGVHQRTLNRLVRFIDQFKSMNFTGDRQMEEQLDQVRREFLSRSAEEYRDDAFARERLQSGLQDLAKTATDLAHQDSRDLVGQFGKMGQRRFHLAA